MSALDDLLSIDQESSDERLAVDLAKNDYELLFALIQARKDSGLKQRDIAKLMGVTQPTIAAFERMDSDPKMSTVRRYSCAVGVLVSHQVVQRNTERTVIKSYSTRVSPSMSVDFTRPTLQIHLAAAANSKRTDFALSA